MDPRLALLTSRSLEPHRVRPDGSLTSPRTFGVYELQDPSSTRRYRFGNHPVRQLELAAEFGRARLLYLFRDRGDAMTAASILNERTR